MQTMANSNKRKAAMTFIGVFVALVADGMDLQILSVSLPSLMQDLHLSKVMAGSLATWTLVGMGAGGILAGWMSDRIGRVKVLAGALFLFSFCTLVLAFTNSYWQFIVMRCISGFGLGAVYVVGNMLAAEFVSTERRTTILATLQAGWSVGYVVAAILSAHILPDYGWRPMFMAAALPGLASFWMLRYLTDSPSWLESRKIKEVKKENEFAIIWSDKKIRRTFLLWAAACVIYLFGYYGAATWLPSYIVKDLGVDLKSMGFYIAGTYMAMILGKVISGLLADKFGRRAMFTFGVFSTALIMPFLVKYATPDSVAYLLMIFGLFYGIPTGIQATYMAESFPTNVRGTAVGTSFNLGRIGSFISPIFIGAIATQHSVGAGIALLGVAYGIVGVITAFFIYEKMYDPKKVTASFAELPEGSTPKGV